MKRRIFQAILSVALVTVTIFMALTVAVLQSGFEGQSRQELVREAGYILQGMRQGGMAYLELLPADSRVTVVTAEGAVLYDNWEEPSRMGDHSDREEIRQALSKGEGWSARYSETLDEKTIYYALRLEDGSVLRVARTRDSVWKLTVQVLNPLAAAVALACGLAALMAFRASRVITKPINAIDPARPERLGTPELYEELEPLMKRLRSQNRQISRQMEQLRQRQEEFTAITENMEEGFLVMDTDAHIMSHNAAALRLLGAEGMPLGPETSVYALSREEGFRACIQEVLAGRRSEHVLEKNDRCCRILASPVHQEGHLDGAVMVILDVTEAEQREGLRREFSANVSHELKTPLTAILGTAEILQNGLVQAQDVPHFAGNIHREAGRLIQLVNDIIRLSRLDEGGVSHDWAPQDLYALAEDVLEQLRPVAERRQITLALRGQSAVVTTVPQILEEILYNLCDNAVKYNRDGGEVTVEVSRTEAGVPQVTVSDTGIGIPAEQRERIFERFYRVDKSRSTTGTGLGLSIVKRGAAYLGAKVELRSEDGKGSAFTVSFP